MAATSSDLDAVDSVIRRITADHTTLIEEFNEWVSSGQYDGFEMMVVAPSTMTARKGRSSAKSLYFIGGESFRFMKMRHTSLGGVVIQLTPVEVSTFDFVELVLGDHFVKVFGEEVSHYLETIELPSGTVGAQLKGIVKQVEKHREEVVAVEKKQIYSNFGEFS